MEVFTVRQDTLIRRSSADERAHTKKQERNLGSERDDIAIANTGPKRKASNRTIHSRVGPVAWCVRNVQVMLTNNQSKSVPCRRPVASDSKERGRVSGPPCATTMICHSIDIEDIENDDELVKAAKRACGVHRTPVVSLVRRADLIQQRAARDPSSD